MEDKPHHVSLVLQLDSQSRVTYLLTSENIGTKLVLGIKIMVIGLYKHGGNVPSRQHPCKHEFQMWTHFNSRMLRLNGNPNEWKNWNTTSTMERSNIIENRLDWIQDVLIGRYLPVFAIIISETCSKYPNQIATFSIGVFQLNGAIYWHICGQRRSSLDFKYFLAT